MTNGPDLNEDREISWWGVATLGLSNEQVKGAIIVTYRVVSTAALLGAYGLLGPVGYGGFASASDAKEVRIDALDSEIFEIRVKQCEALDQGKSALVYTIRFNEKWRVYVNLTGHEPKVPECRELK
jgi:hypothetical protein